MTSKAGIIEKILSASGRCVDMCSMHVCIHRCNFRDKHFLAWSVAVIRC